MKTTKAFIQVALCVACVACGGMDDDYHEASVTHGECKITWTNTTWDVLNLTLYHDDTRDCPQNVTPGDFIEAGGEIVDKNGFYPTFGDGSEAWLFVHNSNFYTCKPDDIGNLVESTEGDFVWFDFDHDGDLDQYVGLWVQFEAATGWDPNRDCPIFEVVRTNNATPNAIAFTKLDYTLEDQ